MNTTVIILLSAAVVLNIILINTIIAMYFYDIAKEKGFSEMRYFLVPFLLGIVGYILVAALPDRNNALKQEKE